MTFEESLAVAGIQATVPAIQLIQVLFGLANTILNNGSDEYPPSATVYDGQSFDFIVVGGGSAGCVMANRLSEIGDWSVLLIEAGGDPPIISNTPGLVNFIGSSVGDWGYETQPDNRTSLAHKNQNIHLINGKFLGGTGGANFMLYLRGNKYDFDTWTARGNTGWDWDTVLKYYKKSEGFKDYDILTGETADLHNTDGYVKISRPHWDETLDYFDAYEEAGHAILEDTNGYSQLGFSSPEMNLYNGVRQSAAVTFIKPFKNRTNLFVLKDTFVRKVNLDSTNKATGVEVRLSDGTIINLNTNKEVIVSAGGINSPVVLINSGIGPQEHLQDVGIEVKINSPQVGKNAQDHQFVILPSTGKENPSSAVNNINLITNVHQSAPIIVGYAALNKSQTHPDYQIIAFPVSASAAFSNIFCSQLVRLEDSICANLVEAGLYNEVFLSTLHLMHPQSRGEILARSNNPEDPPLVYTKYLQDSTNDLETFASSVESYLTVLDTTYFKSVNAKLIDLGVPQCAEYTFNTRDYWKCFIMNTVNSEYHISGTCVMAPDGVVDDKLKVIGATGLRVVDISIMPEITSGGTNAPAMMIAENAADMIKTEYGYL